MTKKQPRQVAVSGASGLVGTELTRQLERQGDRVLRLVRREARDRTEAPWDPTSGAPTEPLAGTDAVVHLAGESIGARWTKERRGRIRESREEGTRNLARTLGAMDEPPSVLVCASAVGYYGDGGDRRLAEDAGAGQGFLAEVCRAWEAAAEPARDAGIRVVHTRFGVVLSPEGGALARMLLPFRLGLGGPIGSGKQWLSWVHRVDVARAIRHVIATPGLSGPVNVVAPEPVRNGTFVKELGHALRRPAVMPLPGFAVKTLFGQMGQETLLWGQRVEPRRLQDSGFSFRYRTLPEAFDALFTGAKR